MDVAIEIPEARLGLIEAEQVRVAPADAGLLREMDEACVRLRRELSLERVAELASVRAIRAMFRAWGVDASRYRPAAEALLRRVVQGRGLYPVSNVVDINNLGSIETGWPYGSYDQGKIDPPVGFRLGRPGEKYEGIGKQVWHLEGRPVLADRQGPFGSPISDSVRTMITASATTVLTVVFAPAGASADLDQAIDRHCRRLERFAGAKIAATAVLGR